MNTQEINDAIEHEKQMLRAFRKRLQQRQLQEAQQGLNTPPEVITEISSLSESIDSHEMELKRLQRIAVEDQIPKETPQLAGVAIPFGEAQVGRVWLSQSSEERQRVNVEVADQMKKAKKNIDIHDSLFSKEIGHPWEQEMIKALNRDSGIRVNLILADPNSDIYKKRYKLVSNRVPNEEWPKQLGEWIQRYPEQLRLRSTDELFSGPFVWIDRAVLFMGFFAPGIHSDQAPFIELRYTESTKSFFEGLEKWIEGRPIVRL
jgi:hypothetical protein